MTLKLKGMEVEISKWKKTLHISMQFYFAFKQAIIMCKMSVISEKKIGICLSQCAK